MIGAILDLELEVDAGGADEEEDMEEAGDVEEAGDSNKLAADVEELDDAPDDVDVGVGVGVGDRAEESALSALA